MESDGVVAVSVALGRRTVERHVVLRAEVQPGLADPGGQVGWADPATGLSFAYLTNGVDTEVLREGTRGVLLADIAARLA